MKTFINQKSKDMYSVMLLSDVLSFFGMSLESLKQAYSMQYVKYASVPMTYDYGDVATMALVVDSHSLRDVIGNQTMRNLESEHFIFAIEDAQFFHI